MTTAMGLLLLGMFPVWNAELAVAPVELPGQAIAGAMFGLREMDMHLHAGLERDVDLDTWLDLAAADGRRAILLLDHIELYRMTPAEAASWAKDRGRDLWYPMGAEGHRHLMGDFTKAAAKRQDLVIFKGWEISESELDADLESAPMAMADAIGWHISPNHKGKPPNGQLLIKRIRQIKEAQQRFPVPMIVFHPFPMRLEHLVGQAKKKGKPPESLSVKECRFFQPGEQQEVVRLLRGSSIYIEMSRATAGYWGFPNMREALIADIKPLARAGVQFIVSTDNHSVQSAKKPFQPDVYGDSCGITPKNTNTLVRELLALKARHASTGH